VSHSQLLLTAGLAAIFLAIVLLLGTVGAITAERQQVTRTWDAMRSHESHADGLRPELADPFGMRVVLPALRRLARLGRALTPAGRIDGIRRRLERAGSPPGWDVDRVLAFKFVGLVLGGALGVALGVIFGKPVVAVGLGVGMLLVGFYTPDAILYHQVDQRKKRMLRELPDSLDMLTISVEAGLAFDAALAQVARNTEGPLAQEFFRVLQEMQIGTGRAEAFRALAERTDLADLQSFVTAVVQADNFGIPVARVLRVQASEMRTKRRQRAEEAAQKVPIKILFPLILCILPAFMIVVVGPAAVTIFRNFISH
jgi:tight adherence protein C